MSTIWLAVDQDGEEWLFWEKPERNDLTGDGWASWEENPCLPKGSIKKLIGKELTWEDEPFEISE